MDLLKRDTRGQDNLFHLGSVLNRNARIFIKRLDKNAPTMACQSGLHERSSIFTGQQPSLNTDAPRQQQLTKLHDSRFALIRSNQVRHFLPCPDHSETLAWVRHNSR
jgi:hypothetical protein